MEVVHLATAIRKKAKTNPNTRKVARRIKLNPTKEQELLFWKSAGTARWAYNFFLSESDRHYAAYIEGKQERKTIKEGDVRKYINNVLKSTTHQWLKEVGNNVMKQAVKDASLAQKRWFEGLTAKPKFKSKRRSKISFYVNYESLKRTKEGFQGEKLGVVKTTEKLPKLPKGKKYSNPRISYDGRNWFLSVGYEAACEEVALTGERLGIDVGIKALAVCSDGSIKQNVNKTNKVKRLEKKLKREQRKQSRKIEANIADYTKNRKPIYKKPLKTLKNVQKQNNQIYILHKKLKNIRLNHLHQASNEIVKTKPSHIVMETLNIKGMMKNKHLAQAIAKQGLYEFKRQIQYKCQKYGIEFIKADSYYPSSKMCSCCGALKQNLKLSERIFYCLCGNRMDRDLNAAKNLANYLI